MTGQDGLRDELEAVLEGHPAEWIEHIGEWDCGCNEHATLAPMPSILDVYRHQADAVLPVVQARIDAAREQVAEAWDAGYERGRADHCDYYPSAESCETSSHNPYRALDGPP